MIQIIAIIIGIIILIALFKAIGGVLLKIAGAVLMILYYVFALVPIVLSKIFFSISKVLHIQSFSYYLLGILSVPSIIYLCKIHSPYSKMEKFVDAEKVFVPRRKKREDTLAMSCFLTLFGVAMVLAYFFIVVDKEIQTLLYGGIIYVIFAFIYTFYKISDWKKENQDFYNNAVEWRKWTQKEVKEISESEIEEKLILASAVLSENDRNKNKFTADEMPYGRAAAFISYFEKNLDDEEPVYFSPKMSPDEEELREYGTLVTTKGVYISAKGKDDVEIPYAGLWTIKKDENKTYFDYGLLGGTQKIVEIENNLSSVKFDILMENFEQVEDISLALLQEKVKTELDEAFESYEKASVNGADGKFDAEQRITDISKAAEIGGVGAGLARNAAVYQNLKNNMDGKQGHGVAAEYANNAIDSLNPFNSARHIGSDNAKHGADRNVNGINIQTKYKETASASVGAAFEDGKAIYLNEDGSMMQIEVPRNQYSKSVELMKKRIEDGQVPGETNPDNAKNYVRRGHITYLQAYNIAGSGSIESIAIDATQGIVCAIPGAGITTVLTFATALWNGQDLKEAAKTSTLAGLKVAGKSAAIYTLTMQLSRGKVVNPFYTILKNSGNNSVKKYGTNYVAKGANKVAKKISSSSLAKTKAGKALKLDKVNGRQVIGGTVTAMVVYGPDVCKAFQGKISGKQLIKNSTVSTAGLVGAALGAAIPIPVVGSMIGGAVGSFVAKKVMDNFIEDDAVTMFKIMREEFLDIVMLYAFNKEEFDMIVSATIASPEMTKVLQAMYQSGNPKDYADALINAEVQDVLSKREKISQEKIKEGMQLLLEDESAA